MSDRFTPSRAAHRLQGAGHCGSALAQPSLSLERLGRSDRPVAAVGLALVTALAWLELWRMAAVPADAVAPVE